MDYLRDPQKYLAYLNEIENYLINDITSVNFGLKATSTEADVDAILAAVKRLFLRNREITAPIKGEDENAHHPTFIPEGVPSSAQLARRSARVSSALPIHASVMPRSLKSKWSDVRNSSTSTPCGPGT